MNNAKKYKIKIVCPECNADKKNFNYDIYKEELTCKKCGLVITAPYIAGIIFPGVKKIKIKIKDLTNGSSVNPEKRTAPSK